MWGRDAKGVAGRYDGGGEGCGLRSAAAAAAAGRRWSALREFCPGALLVWYGMGGAARRARARKLGDFRKVGLSPGGPFLETMQGAGERRSSAARLHGVDSCSAAAV